MSCLYLAESQQCKAAHGVNAMKIGYSSRGRETRQKGLRQQGYGGFHDWEIKNCEWFRWEGLNAQQLESLERGVFGYLEKNGSRRLCPDASEIVSARKSDVYAAFRWAKRHVQAGTWVF